MRQARQFWEQHDVKDGIMANIGVISGRRLFLLLAAFLCVVGFALPSTTPVAQAADQEIALGPTTMGTAGSQTIRNAFSTVVEEVGVANYFTIDMPGQKTLTINDQSVYNTVYVNGQLVSGVSSRVPENPLTVTRNPSTGLITVNFANPIPVNQGDQLTIEVAFKPAVDPNSSQNKGANAPAIHAWGRVDTTPAPSPEPEPEPEPAPTTSAAPSTNPTTSASPSTNPTTSPTSGSTTTAPPSVPSDGVYDAKAIGNIQIGNTSIGRGNPGRISTTVTEDALFEKAVFTVKAPNSILAVENYTVDITQIEEGVSVDYRVLSVSSDQVVIEVFPVKNSTRVPSATVPAGSVITATGFLTENPVVQSFQLDVYGNLPEETVTPPTVVMDDYPWLPDAYQNPPLQQRCGQNIAIVFDVSRSIERDEVNGIRNAGNAVIDALAGSAANVGLFNFASVSPSIASAEQAQPLSLSDPNNVQTLRNKINSLRMGATYGTNWEAGLRSVIDSGYHYDAVYFVTDGMPSYNNAGTASDFDGYWTHTADLARAIDAANELKQGGTHIEAIPVKLPSEAERYPEYLLKDTVYPTVTIAQSDFYRKGDMAVGPGQGYFLGEGIDKGIIRVLDRSMRDITLNQTRWTDGRLTGTQMIRQMLGPDQFNRDRYSTNPINDWQALTETLKNSIVGPCSANLIVNKILKSADGTERPGPDWVFTAEAPTNNIVTKYGPSGEPERRADSASQKTDAEGRTVFGIGSTADQKVTVTEDIPAGSNFQLEQQNGFNARCTQQVADRNGNITTQNVEVTNNGPTGFDLTMVYESSLGAVRSVECWVVNSETAQQQTVKIEKLSVDGGTTPLSGAEFKIYKVAEDGSLIQNPSREVPVTTGTDNIHTAVVDTPGDYYLVETKSPAGLMLLAQPVKFRASWNEGEPAIEFLDGGSALITSAVGKDDTSQWSILQVADINQGDLPKSGGSGIVPPLLAAIAIFAAAGAAMRRRA